MGVLCFTFTFGYGGGGRIRIRGRRTKRRRNRTQETILVSLDGSVRTFTESVKVAEVVAEAPPGSFVCDPDAVFIGQMLYSLGPNQRLEPGQLYFLLPCRKLEYVVTASDMASLLLLADSAIKNHRRDNRIRRRKWRIIAPLTVKDREEEETEESRGLMRPLDDFNKKKKKKLETIQEYYTLF